MLCQYLLSIFLRAYSCYMAGKKVHSKTPLYQYWTQLYEPILWIKFRACERSGHENRVSGSRAWKNTVERERSGERGLWYERKISPLRSHALGPIKPIAHIFPKMRDLAYSISKIFCSKTPGPSLREGRPDSRPYPKRPSSSSPFSNTVSYYCSALQRPWIRSYSAVCACYSVVTNRWTNLVDLWSSVSGNLAFGCSESSRWRQKWKTGFRSLTPTWARDRWETNRLLFMNYCVICNLQL